MTDKVLAWHWLPENKKTRYSAREVRVGQTIVVHQRKRKLELCKWGLHASEGLLDALPYAPGPIICRVELSGEILRGNDKLAATRRKCIAMADATYVLHEFACWYAENALSLIEKPDPRSVAAIQAKRRWMRGEITDAELDAAWDAAWAAAWAAARAAARAAAWDAQERELSRRMHELLGTKE